MIATLRRILTPAPPPSPREVAARELDKLEPRVEALRIEIDAAREELFQTNAQLREAARAAEDAEGEAWPAARRSHAEAWAARARAERRYREARERWAPLSSERRRLRERVRLLDLGIEA